MISAKELKQKYIAFFTSKGHEEIPSASILPQNDPTVLFTTAGMQPLVPFLLGQAHPKGKRLVDAQKCMRTGDIEEVGDTTHHTFFEMLGNWSLGDYFKKETLEWAFEFLTKELNIPIEKLAVTVYEGDDTVPKDEESVEIWKGLGIPQERISYLGREDNWWGPAGQTGPCGPDSEIFYWTGDEPAPAKHDAEDERWVEIWNCVFMQYNKDKDGNFTPLEQKNVDTGMGLERVAAVLQGHSDNYKTDLFTSIIAKIESLSGKSYDDEHKRSMRIIADHIKAATMVLGENKGVVPSNVDQGYILRRLIRRAIRHARMLGIEGNFTAEIAKEVMKLYPEYHLEEHKDHIITELGNEEEKFSKTLQQGLKEFEKLTEGKDTLSGEETFLLFQSYGFPLEMTQELAEEKSITVDVDGFTKAYETHQEKSRAGAEQKFKGGLADDSVETTRLHTATHLLNQALREVLGPEVKQKGSNITKERLRFDFNFDRKLTDEEKKAVEDKVNQWIEEGIEVVRTEMPLTEALDSGAQSEFGAKYPDTVSVYTMGHASKEICMGPHVHNTKELGHFKIKKEESSASGIRRIKAILE